jgi:alpha-beta hydrolase superfamily lysophospholipase
VWLRRLVLLALLTLLTLTLGCTALDQRQRRWIFQPSDRVWGGAQAAAEGLESRWIEFESSLSGRAERLHGVWLPQADAKAPVMLYLHGAKWDVRGSAHRLRRMQSLGFAVLAIDYRGFGRSSPALPSEDLAHEDVQAAWDWLAKHHPAPPRVIFGHSLGGAIATRLAAEVEGLTGLIVEGSFSSIPDVVSHYRWGWLPIGGLITQRFDAAAAITRVRAPVMVVHGEQDRTIPWPVGRALYERAPHPKRWLLVPGGTHHDTNGRALQAYREAMRDLFGLQLPEPG